MQEPVQHALESRRKYHCVRVKRRLAVAKAQVLAGACIERVRVSEWLQQADSWHALPLRRACWLGPGGRFSCFFVGYLCTSAFASLASQKPKAWLGHLVNG